VRVIGGILRRKKLCSLRGQRIRPTSDYLRESIFNILGDDVKDAIALDLFAGTGGLGIEALSRGALSGIFVDNDPQAIQILVRNISACRLQERCTVLKRDILQGLGFLKKMDRAFNLVFADPPYDKGFAQQTLRLLDRSGCTSKGACVVIEHSIREEVPEKVGHLEQTGRRQHGKAAISFYEFVL